jgi:hypothetical protein
MNMSHEVGIVGGEELERAVIPNAADTWAYDMLTIAVDQMKFVRQTLQDGELFDPERDTEIRVGSSVMLDRTYSSIAGILRPLQPQLHGEGYRVFIYHEGSTLNFRQPALTDDDPLQEREVLTPLEMLEQGSDSRIRQHIEAYAHFVDEAYGHFFDRLLR